MQFDCSASHLLDHSAERLVIRGFRCWMAGYDLGDIQCWETAWREVSHALGPKDGRYVLAELQFWARVLRDVSVRQISYFPYCCRHVCHDECMALSMLSAYQRQDLQSVRAAAFYLSGLQNCPAFEQLTDACGGLASALVDVGQILIPVTRDVIENIATHDRATHSEIPKVVH